MDPIATPLPKARFKQYSAISRQWRTLCLALALLIYINLAAFQLGLPGLHYDEAKEAGVNAVELLNGLPVTAFRDATLDLFGLRLPLMVQDYIGALNVYIALPILAFTGIGVPNLRAVGLLAGLLTLLFVERAISEWVRWQRFDNSKQRAQPTTAALIALVLLAASPSFVFWSRQGIFVTNLVQTFVFLALWQLISWCRTGQAFALILCTLCAGLALYAKLTAGWIILPIGLMATGWWVRRRLRTPAAAPPPSRGALLVAALLFLVALTPLMLFNLQTGGTFSALGQNISQSYYGVDNRAFFDNLTIRLQHIRQILRGDHFWYLGGIYANPAAPWSAAVILLFGLLRRPRLLLAPLLLLVAAIAISTVTITDLFVTHYALLLPLVIGTSALGVWTLFEEVGSDSVGSRRRLLLVAGLLVIGIWVGGDMRATVGYHRALAESGGLADHSDASYKLAYHLQHNGMHTPIVLDWGLDATMRFLSAGVVRPIEIFGYATTAEADSGFSQRLALFLDNPHNVYLLRAPGQSIFKGRRERFFAICREQGLHPVLRQTFAQRDGSALFEIWQVESK